ncbi:hypothetical protein PLESTB_000065600 [Pleodorina starrii]|uniref:Semialdehyde dehydrogenase NAD-binding domain-containing protein n=1 Tax=Pleodorina starrii TaxID=330485 RepID=A0A9W6BAH4_9CHLO|nr:hypothetical protein PLESTM_001607800 [Pleodorina starrii]GLC48158.1 hypothetical protein PLESTB_000065600 [Pleodorina starrii]GLC67406.1 hypothetical protein PLESTF_000552700 [Pleodorina starrii]
MASGLTAVVLGATGAIGEALVNQLVVHPKFKRVVTVGRRALEAVPAESERKAELVQATVNMDALETEAKQAFSGADVVFCALGTTRKVAGSAEAFIKVDLDYVAAGARLAMEAGAPHFSLVSAQGANHKCPANDFALFHPLLYTRTKGLAEQAVLHAGFQRVSLFRPGLLDRGAKARGGEKMFLGCLSNIHVKEVARLMILDVLRDPSTAQPVMRFEMGDLMKAAKQTDQAPAPSK